MTEAREPESNGPRGPTADSIAAACRALRVVVGGARVEDLAVLDETDDLLLFVRRPDPTGDAGERVAIQIAVGGRRGRVTTTRRRFPRHRCVTGPRVDALRRLLNETLLEDVAARPGDRACQLAFRAVEGHALTLHAELHGARGLWVLCNDQAEILALSRLPGGRGARLRPGSIYEAPPPPPRSPSPPAADPHDLDPEGLLAALDDELRSADRAREDAAERHALAQALDREKTRRTRRLEGLQRQADLAADPRALRRDADLILAYGHGFRSTHPVLEVPDPTDPERTLRIERDPSVLPHVQAERLYREARRLEDGRAVAEERLDAARAALTALDTVEISLAADELAEARALLEGLGVLEPLRPKAPDPATQKLRKLTGGENFRRFRTAEGLDVLVGRDDRQNDRLTTRVARGDDVWMHVGRGYAGSHVLIRVPKGKSASLESLLDGATLAVHFSKVRGASHEEVLYTSARNVRKAKGLPPGRVLATRTRSIRVRLEPDRLRRLLDSDPSQPSTR
ncbi:MAG: NFACT RNA binding domain-containing protein [Planctomycetota bacterium]